MVREAREDFAQINAWMENESSDAYATIAAADELLTCLFMFTSAVKAQMLRGVNGVHTGYTDDDLVALHDSANNVLLKLFNDENVRDPRTTYAARAEICMAACPPDNYASLKKGIDDSLTICVVVNCECALHITPENGRSRLFYALENVDTIVGKMSEREQVIWSAEENGGRDDRCLTSLHNMFFNRSTLLDPNRTGDIDRAYSKAVYYVREIKHTLSEMPQRLPVF